MKTLNRIISRSKVNTARSPLITVEVTHTKNGCWLENVSLRKFCFGQGVFTVDFPALNMISSERMAFIAWFFFFPKV
jgi:hypothetical protein